MLSVSGNKFISILLLGVFMLSFASAFEFDNYYSYNESTQTASFKNGLTFGSDIAQIKLNTPRNMRVAPGYNYVFEFEIWGDVVYSDFVRGIYVHNKKEDYDLINRDIDLKYFNGYETKYRNLTGCINEKLSPNSTMECTEYGSVGTHEYEVEVWDDYNKDLEKDSHLIIRGYTNVEVNDRIEWYIDFFGAGKTTDYGTKGVKEWASWTSGLNIGLISFYKLNETTGSVIDSAGPNNGTNVGATRGVVGIINNSFNFTATNQDSVNLSNGTDFNFDGITDPMSISLWVNFESFVAVNTFISKEEDGSPFIGWEYGHDGSNIFFAFVRDGTESITVRKTITLNTGQFYHMVIVYPGTGDANDVNIFINGTNQTGLSIIQNNLVSSVENSINTLIGARDKVLNPFDGRIDEIGIWNRSLTQAEVTQLYNNGDGITFSTEGVVTILNNPANDTAQTSNLVEFNWTITPLLLNTTNWTFSIFFNNGTLLLQEINTSINTNESITVLHNETIASGNYIWNVESCAVDGVEICAFSENRTFAIDSEAPVITIINPTGNEGLNFIGGNQNLNWTVTDANLDTCWFDYNGTNITVTCSANSTTFILEIDNLNLTFYANDTAGQESNVFRSWIYNVLQNNITFNSSSVIGKLETYNLNITFDSSLFTPNVFLIYNGTETTATTSQSGDTRVYSASRITPFNGIDTNYTFHFRVEDVNGTSNSTFNNQTVITFNISSCGGLFTNEVFTFTLLDEEFQTSIGNTTSNFAFNLFSKDRTASLINSSGTNLSNVWSICVNGPIPESVEYSADVTIQYEAVGFAKEFYNIVNSTLSNTTGVQLVNLFDLNLTDSTEFRFTFTGGDGFPVEDALVFLNRKYIEDDNFQVVELPQTDSEGQTTLHMVQNEVIYNIIVMKGGVTLGVFNNLVAFCNDPTIGDCEIILSGADSTTKSFDYDDFIGITFSQPSFDNTTRVVSFSFATIDGTQKDVEMIVTRANVFGNTSVCSDSLTASSGTLLCTVTSNINDSSLIISVLVDVTQIATLNIKIEDDGFSSDGFLIFFFIIGGIVLMTGDSKEMVLLGSAIGVIAGLGYGFTNSSLISQGSAFMSIIVIIIAGIWKLNKDRPQ
ncbi:hypothetical protein LCGC14_1095320 [marine sediment metagenome]|uniref:LamG-like jellyroll fold domain-containing protein n=1 Tax=marine sediment metagenome TaxID=412755 RepID=A0A0F9PU73_9ZZZZ